MKTLFFLALMIFSMGMTSCSKDDLDALPTSKVEIGTAGDELLLPNTQKILDEYSIPAIAGMTIKSGKILEKIELGRQKIDETNPIVDGSKWHMGSITKSMTATLTGILIEAGYLDWNTKIGDITTEGYLEEYQGVTIYELLSHTGGITAEDYPTHPLDERPVSVQRQEWALAALNVPQGNVGEHVYSNSSYVIAGVMLESIMGISWEELITTYLFKPLEMNDTGFGAPGKEGGLNQPWGHKRTGSKWLAMAPTDVYSDNSAALGPGGTVHTTLLDISKYANLHLGKTTLIQASTLEILHTEVKNSGYSLGWGVTEYGIAHAGSNTLWFAQLFINLEEEVVNFSVTNSYDLEGTICIPAVQKMMSVMGQRLENSL
ncbi:serine hydrolase domain-containing protein [Ulvibacterium sp.]|uniref:serine hydrolase domain-containing protein n=1 Tax=Ulvibacterium sp. TaxID=2665914 RepID=UPI003BADA5B3